MGPTKASGHTPGRGSPSRALRRCAWGVPCFLALLLVLGLLGPSEMLLQIWDSDDAAYAPPTSHASRPAASEALSEARAASAALPEPEPIPVPESLSHPGPLSVLSRAASASGQEPRTSPMSGGRAAGVNAERRGAEGEGAASGASGTPSSGEAEERFNKQVDRLCLEGEDPAMADVAVVLVGQLRRFEASGPSLLRWLFTPPPQSATPPHPTPTSGESEQKIHSIRRSLIGNEAKSANIGVSLSRTQGQSAEGMGRRERGSGDGGVQGTMGTPQGIPQGPGESTNCSRGEAEALLRRSCLGQCWFSMPEGEGAEGASLRSAGGGTEGLSKGTEESGTREGKRELVDLFVITSLDDNTFKLLGLLLPLPEQSSSFSTTLDPESRIRAGAAEGTPQWRLQRPPTLGFLSVSVLPDFNVDASKYPADKLYGLEHGPQGLLRQFHMEAKALEKLRAHEQQGRGGRVYRWILKTRPDTFWSGPPPSLVQLPAITSAAGSGLRAGGKVSEAARRIVYAPVGLDFGGVNDRLALGPSEAMGPVFSRLSLLWQASRLWPRSAYKSQVLNAELVLRLSLEAVYGHNTSVSRTKVPFCLLSRRDWMSMRSLAHQHPTRGGDYCRPCTPSQGSPGLCASKGDWESDWERLYDSAAGPPQAHHRALLMSLPTQGTRCQQLVRQMERMLSGPGAGGGRLGDWDAPSASNICHRRLLGPVRVVGPHKNPGASWPVAVDLLRSRCFGDRGCVVYSQGSQAGPAQASKGRRMSPESLPFRWELMLLCALGAASDTTPLDRNTDPRAKGTPGAASASVTNPLETRPTPHSTGKLGGGSASGSASNPFSSNPHARGRGVRVRRRSLRAWESVGRFLTLVSPDAAPSVLRSARHAASLPLRVGSTKFSRQQAEGVVRYLGVADRMPKGSSVWKTMQRMHHTSVDLLKLGADEVDVHVRSWHAWSRTPPVCQLLLHVGTRAVKQAHTQWQQGPGGAKMATVPSGEALAWDTLVGWLRELGFLFDQCAAATSEAQGRCLFFNPSQCSFQ